MGKQEDQLKTASKHKSRRKRNKERLKLFKKQNWSTATERLGKKLTRLMKSYIQKEYQVTSGKQNT